jgi:hypothetical protein
MCSVKQEIDDRIHNKRRGRKVEIVCDINFTPFKEMYTSGLGVTANFFIFTVCRDK